jgi:hypothetical protein
MKKRILATILAILFMLPICAMALDYPAPELDQQAAVKRIADAKLYYLETGDASDVDTPDAIVIIDYLDLYNTRNLSFTQRLVIINN